MTNSISPAQQISTLIGKLEPAFLKMVKETNNGMVFQQEAMFAQQCLLNNDFLMNTALKNPNSLVASIVNTATIGISLNPALGLAYLVPRDGRVILDISYRGLVKLATDTGAIHWAKAELVYDGDFFRYRGPATLPEHSFDPFATLENRGEFRGTYCIAKTSMGDVLIEAMSADQVYKVRSKSQAFTREKGASGPWVEWFDQMVIKTVLKRARKSWPMSSPRLDHAIHMLNVDNGEGFVDNSSGRDITQLEHQMMDDSGVSIGAVNSAVNSAAEIPEAMLQRVAAVVERAESQRAWKAAEDWVRDRLRGAPREYALKKLAESEKQAANPVH